MNHAPTLTRTPTHTPTRPAPRVIPRGTHAPEPVQVLIGGRWISARAHSSRFSRRGPQTLIDCNGRLFWVNSARVRHLEKGEQRGSA